MLCVKQVNKSYYIGKKQKHSVLKEVNMELPEKGMIAIVGESGSGKTTLLNIIGGLTKPDSGSISINGQEIGSNNEILKNIMIGYVFQDYCLREQEIVYENIADALKIIGCKNNEEIEKLVNAALKCVGMERFGKRISSSLSGGQKQRVAIARATVKSPSILLADEPTGNLDEQNTLSIMSLLWKISQTKLVIMVTHDMSLVSQFCNGYYEIKDGILSDLILNTPEGKFAKKEKALYISKCRTEEHVTRNGKITIWSDQTDNKVNINLIFCKGVLYVQPLLKGNQVKVIEPDFPVIEENNIEEKQRETELPLEIIDHVAIQDNAKVGVLFSIKDLLKRGFERTTNKIEKNWFRRVAFMLCAVLFVIVSGICGISVKNMGEAKLDNNANAFYGYINSPQMYDQFMHDIESNRLAADYISISSITDGKDQQFCLNIKEYPSTFVIDWEEMPMAYLHGIVLPIEQMKLGFKLVAGRCDELNDNEVVLSTLVANQILDKRIYSFLNGYSSLIGMSITGRSEYVIAGIVESEENELYASSKGIAFQRFREEQPNVTFVIDDNINPGEVNIILSESIYEKETVKYEDQVQINGEVFNVGEVIVALDKNEGKGLITYIMTSSDFITCGNSFGSCKGIGFIDEFSESCYVMIYSKETKQAEEYVREFFGAESDEYGFSYATPDVLYQQQLRTTWIEDKYRLVIWGLFAIAVTFIIFFVVNSDISSEYREVGICRCIGVKKTNILMRYATENIVLILFTACVGWLIASICIWSIQAGRFAYIISDLIFYPVWIGLLIVAFFLLASLLCKLIPLIVLMKKPPREIM